MGSHARPPVHRRADRRFDGGPRPPRSRYQGRARALGRGRLPDGLRGEAIPLPRRIVLACDAYHAMTSDRPYRPAMTTAAARAEPLTNAGTQFDPDVVAALDGVLEGEEAIKVFATTE